MTDNEVIEFLRKPYGEWCKNRLLCGCGNLQTHTLRWCKDCGGEFKFDPAKVSRITVIMNQVMYNPFRKKDDNGYRWWLALYQRQIGCMDIEKFKQLCKETL